MIRSICERMCSVCHKKQKIVPIESIRPIRPIKIPRDMLMRAINENHTKQERVLGRPKLSESIVQIDELTDNMKVIMNKADRLRAQLISDQKEIEHGFFD